ncbi:MAG TPA: alkaline phosphatase D family protein, partial [Acidovorax defluvii]|nr:alkaline phosphatase D family protein [Acidovorax defluvii]
MTPLQRRAFLQRAALVAAAGTLPRWAWSNHPLQHDPFALGVASGDPTPDGVVLWTRLLPTQHGDLSDPFTVRWELADDPAFRRIVQRGQATALPALGHSVHVELTGLAPARWYHYRFMLGDAISATGRTRTAPAADAMDAHLRIAFASCQRWEHGHYAAWRHLCADQPDLVLFLGDYIYEYASPPATTGLARVHALRHASTLADFRDRYALHKSDPALQAAHAACPWAVTWDDHEVQNDYAGAQGKGSQGDPVAFLALRSAAWQAFYENMPLRAASLLAPDFGALQVYRRLRWGRLAQVHLLDTRQHRQWQACRPADPGGGAPPGPP